MNLPNDTRRAWCCFLKTSRWASPKSKAAPDHIIPAAWNSCWNAAACIRARCAPWHTSNSPGCSATPVASRLRWTISPKADIHFDQIRLLGGPIPDPQHAWETYFDILNQPDAAGRTGRERFPLTTYVHVLTREEAIKACQANAKIKPEDYEKIVGQPFYQPDGRAQPDDLALQYWFCYYFDDWANIHEGDWESITIFLRRQENAWTPLGATYSAHENGTRRHWRDIERLEDTHPVVYVASGSHASYFQHAAEGHSTELAGIFLGKLKFKIGFSTSARDFVPPLTSQHPLRTLQVEVLPDPIDMVSADNPARRHLKWMTFKGSWGARELGRLIAGGPIGPAHKGLKWLNPFAWSEAECWPDYLIY